ncbi:MAG TPA: glutathione synthase [Gammaproteobacteria bacterium]|nr:glutathione synthase [Gammaproteobacteria bacterium]
MKNRLGVVMDSIEAIKIHKDSTFAMLLEAQRRQFDIDYIEISCLSLSDGKPFARSRPLKVMDNTGGWFQLGEARTIPLQELDVILMRKDPPFDMEYIYATYILQLAHEAGTLVINRPDSLRDANEKIYTAWFQQCCPPTLVSRDATQIRAFLDTHNDIILKPPGGMGGASIFRVQQGDLNTNVIIETLTRHGENFCMAQRFIPEIRAGDKRILIIDGNPVPYALARIPAAGENRGNLAAGGRGEGVALTERDYWICEQLAPALKESGLLFVGIDVIGDYLTEINVTSPTCIRELDRIYDLNIAGTLFDCIESKQ